LFSGDRAKRNLTRRSSIKIALAALCAPCLRANESGAAGASTARLLRNIPSRTSNALTGTQFAETIARMDRQQREQAILSNLLDGNLPAFLKQLVPVKLSYQLVGGASVAATIFVMPEYLSIGSDTDFLRIPMNLHTAVAVADRFGFVLPTKKIVDAIYEQSASRLTPQPLPAGPQMTSTEYYQLHNTIIDQQAEVRAIPKGALVAGHKKDIVLTNRLSRMPGRIAIYGWHRAKGDPIQPLSTVHGAGYADYSHGIRLVAGLALIEGRLRSVYNILRDAALAPVLSDEGAIRLAPAFGNV
jgi:hypothetical protein